MVIALGRDRIIYAVVPCSLPCCRPDGITRLTVPFRLRTAGIIVKCASPVRASSMVLREFCGILAVDTRFNPSKVIGLWV
jgi:hypothetical protein